MIALISRTKLVIEYTLLQTFCHTGPQSIIQKDNGREFSSIEKTRRGIQSIITNNELTNMIKITKQLLPSIVLVKGAPYYSETNSSVKCLNQSIKDKSRAWMYKNNNMRWSVGTLFIQWKINTQIVCSTGNKSLRELLTRKQLRRGVLSLPIESKSLESLKDKAGLNQLFHVAYNSSIKEHSYNVLLNQYFRTNNTILEITRNDDKNYHDSNNLIKQEPNFNVNDIYKTTICKEDNDTSVINKSSAIEKFSSNQIFK